MENLGAPKPIPHFAETTVNDEIAGSLPDSGDMKFPSDAATDLIGLSGENRSARGDRTSRFIPGN